MWKSVKRLQLLILGPYTNMEGYIFWFFRGRNFIFYDIWFIASVKRYNAHILIKVSQTNFEVILEPFIFFDVFPIKICFCMFDFSFLLWVHHMQGQNMIFAYKH